MRKKLHLERNELSFYTIKSLSKYAKKEFEEMNCVNKEEFNFVGITMLVDKIPKSLIP